MRKRNKDRQFAQSARLGGVTGVPIAILCSDLHLSHKPPLARTVEPCWYKAMERVLARLRKAQQAIGDVPVLFAGDLFDTWKVPAELINFAITNLPNNMLAIAGQHDLMYHRHEEIDKTPFWTLVKSGKIVNVPSYNPVTLKVNNVEFEVYGSHWRQTVPEINNNNKIKILLKHSYVWIDGHNYLGAKSSNKLDAFINEISKFDMTVFGDNHSHFITAISNRKVVNCGCMMRRKQNEREYKPVITIITDKLEHKTLEIEPTFVMGTPEESVVYNNEELDIFVKNLAQTEHDIIDFITLAQSWCMSEIEKEVARVILDAIERVRASDGNKSGN